MQNQRTDAISHTSPWWYVKLLGGAGLIVQVALAFGDAAIAVGSLMVWLGQGLALAGGGLTVWHWILLKQASARLDCPEDLVTNRGLFRIVRHPMYLGDAWLYLGLALIVSQPASLLWLVLGWAGIFGQSRFEDALMAARFGHQFTAWRLRTGLLLPRLLIVGGS